MALSFYRTQKVTKTTLKQKRKILKGKVRIKAIFPHVLNGTFTTL